jgi:hypothetical protein
VRQPVTIWTESGSRTQWCCLSSLPPYYGVAWSQGNGTARLMVHSGHARSCEICLKYTNHDGPLPCIWPLGMSPCSSCYLGRNHSTPEMSSGATTERDSAKSPTKFLPGCLVRLSSGRHYLPPTSQLSNNVAFVSLFPDNRAQSVVISCRGS